MSRQLQWDITIWLNIGGAGALLFLGYPGPAVFCLLITFVGVIWAEVERDLGV